MGKEKRQRRFIQKSSYKHHSKDNSRYLWDWCCWGECGIDKSTCTYLKKLRYLKKGEAALDHEFLCWLNESA